MKEKSGPPPRWEEFVKVKYQGGKSDVPNPNPDTKQVFPKVKFTTALKYKPFLAKVLKEYKAWAGEAQKEDPSRGGNPTSAVTLEAYSKLWDNRDDLLGEYRSAILEYTGTAYTEINNHLRLGEQVSRKAKEAIQDLDAAFKGAKSPAAITAYRTLSLDNPLGKRVREGSLKVGTVLEDKGFVSTTLDPNYAYNKGLKLVMKVPKGYPAIWVDDPPSDDYTANPGEKEVLLKRDTKMRVTKVTGSEIHVEVLP